MADFILFWLAKPVAEALMGVGILVAILVIYFLFSIPRVIRQSLCDHPSVHETRSCDAICRKCGLNLGFIGDYRDRQRGK